MFVTNPTKSNISRPFVLVRLRAVLLQFAEDGVRIVCEVKRIPEEI